MLVTAVGTHSQTGIIMSLLVATDEKSDGAKSDEGDDAHKKEDASSKSKKKEQSVLQAKLTRLAIQIGYGGMTIAILTVIVLIIRYCIKEYAILKNPFTVAIISPLIKIVITGITVLVVAVPEGLPLAVTISLAYAVKVRMIRFYFLYMTSADVIYNSLRLYF